MNVNQVGEPIEGGGKFQTCHHKRILNLNFKARFNQRPQPTQIIWVCPDIWVFSSDLENRHLSDIWVICQKCQFEVLKGWGHALQTNRLCHIEILLCEIQYPFKLEAVYSHLGAWMHYICCWVGTWVRVLLLY